MTPPKHSPLRSILACLPLGLFVVGWPASAYANVYATNIKINGSLTNATAAQGASVSISYILNEPASAGVKVNILAGSTTVRTLTFPPNVLGAARGTNMVTWDGQDENHQNVPAGSYSVSINAASTGYPVWTQITTDYIPDSGPGDPGTYLWWGRGLAVDRNADSPFYGRVFAANAVASSAGHLGDQVGIIKCNADGSFADEGGFSDGGHTWAGDQYSPWKIEVSADDFVYVNDMTSNGEIYHWNPTLSPASQIHVLRPDNWGNPGGVGLSGPAIVGAGPNTQIYLADRTFPSLGIVRYALTNNGVCATNDTGTTVVQTGTTSDLNFAPNDVAVDAGGAIYTIQRGPSYSDTSARVLRFRAYTNGGPAELTADWTNAPDGLSEASSGPWCNASGVAVDTTGTYLAVTFAGDIPANGNTKIFYATNGALVTNLDVYVSGEAETRHSDTDCAWDAVGNLYYIHDGSTTYGWRAVSPPGTNSATTRAVVSLQIGVTSINITSITVSGGIVTITFTGPPADLPAAFALLSSAIPSGNYSPAAGAAISGSSGNYRATVAVNGPKQFYRIQRVTAPIQPPHISTISVSGSVVTITFSGAASDLSSAFTLVSSATPNGTYTAPIGVNITGSGGSYQATIATSGSKQFYRIKR